MRKIIIIIILCLLLIGSGFIFVKGNQKVNIYGVKDISSKNDEIDKKNEELSNLISVTFENSKDNLKKTANNLVDTKTEYENQATLLASTLSPSYALKTEKYELDFLWTELGNYAKDEGVIIKIDVRANKVNSSYYDLDFAVTGTYTGITDFIYDIENNTKLGFKIEEFGMSMVGDNLTGTFSCKDIAINVGKIDSSEQSNAEDKGENNTNNNTTSGNNTAGGNNTANTNNTSNATNTTNTTNNTSGAKAVNNTP